MAMKKNVVRLRKGEVPHLTIQPGSEEITFPVIYESLKNRNFSDFRKNPLSQKMLNCVYSVLLDEGLIINTSYAYSQYFSDNKIRKNRRNLTGLRGSEVRFGDAIIVILWLNLPSTAFVDDVIGEILSKSPHRCQVDNTSIVVCSLFCVHLIRLKNQKVVENRIIYNSIDETTSKTTRF